jgi:hypothetical protein
MPMALLVLFLAAAPDAPPAGLACLPKWYAVEPVQTDGGWALRFSDGGVAAYDDGKAKSFEQKLEAPDMEDTYAALYTKGPIAPVLEDGHDSGRIRFDPIFRATYGDSAANVDVVPITFLGQKLKVHRKAKDLFARVEQRLHKAIAADPKLEPYLQNIGGTFNWRKIANSDRQSAHSYGISMDINVARSNYWEWQRPKTPLKWVNQIPQAIVDAFEAEGFIWGGRWLHYDTMHFEYRPELLEPACRP